MGKMPPGQEEPGSGAGRLPFKGGGERGELFVGEDMEKALEDDDRFGQARIHIVMDGIGCLIPVRVRARTNPGGPKRPLRRSFRGP